MKLNILGSNSAGNCYVLQNDSEALIIEAGIDFRTVKKSLDFNLSKVSAAVITHQHGDHSKYVASFVNNGVLTLALEDVFSSHGIFNHAFAKSIVSGKCYKAGNFFIQAFPVSHDVPCVGYLIKHSEFGKLLFVTDTVTMNYKFDGLTEIMIEANYADDILDRRLASKDITLVQFDMMLPDGLTIPVDADDELRIAIAGRTTTNKHSLDASAIGGGYRFLLASMKNSVLTGTEGAIIAITLVAASYFNGGTITLKEIELVSPDETAVNPVPISIEVNTTPAAIKNTVFKNGPQTFYDLLGRKVNDIKKGIWVTEGHKAVK